jgi:hypothetical protein
MKRNLLCAAAIAAIAGAAHAAPTTAAAAAAAPNKLYISGSSALQKLVEGMVRQNCSGDTLSIWRSAAGQTWAGSTTADTTNGASHNIYACTLNATNDFGLSGDILVVKREAGGSGQGVFPIGGGATGGLAQLMMNISNPACTAAGGLNATCSGPSASSEVNVQADMGISDVEPAVFNATFNKASAFGALSVTDTSFDAAPTAIGQFVGGLIVNAALYNALQAEQVASGAIPAGGVPSISSTGFASLLTSTYNTSLAWTPLFGAGSSASLVGTHINVAFRATGSGTRAAAGLFFNNYPSGLVSKNFANGSTTNSFSGAVDSARSVFNASSSGNVIGAVDACGADRYCVGLLGADQVLTSANTKFVRIDGAAIENARLGQYGFLYESTYQVNKTGLNGASGKTFANAFGAALALPANIYSANNPNAPTLATYQGFLALPGKCNGTFASWTAAPESVVCSRVTRNGNSNNTLTISK